MMIGLSLFLCSAAALLVTMRSASVSDLRRKPVRQRRLLPIKRKKDERETTDQVPLVDRRRLDEHARSLEGLTFFF